MIITIHQPDFMPWYGFFRKIYHADIWVVLDHTENNPREAAFWGRRVKVLVNGQEHWLSITLNKPEEKGRIGIPVHDMTLNLQNRKALQKLKKTVQMAYSKAPFFDEYAYLLDDYFDSDEPKMMPRNMNFIKEMMKILGCDTKLVYSSDLNPKASSTEMLVEIIQSMNGDVYLSGTGADGYQDVSLYKDNGIEVIFNKFDHPTYEQLLTDDFVPGLSILDMLFMKGPDFIIEHLEK